MKLIDYEVEFKNYERISKDRNTIKQNIGKKVIYVDRVDNHRGYYRIEYGVICAVRYNTVYLNDYNNSFDIRDLRDIGVEK